MKSRLFLLLLLFSSLTFGETANILQEEWFVLYWDQNPVGYQHSVSEAVKTEDGSRLIKTTGAVKMSISRMGAQLEISTQYEITESEAKGLDSFSYALNMGSMGTVSARGERRGDTLRITGAAMGQKYEREEKFAEDTFSYWKENRIFREALKKGKTSFSHRLFEPTFQREVEVFYTVEGEEILKFEKPVKTKRVKVVINILPELATYLWVDANGDTQKTKSSFGGFATIEGLRTTKEKALVPVGPAEVLVQTLIKPDKTPKNPRSAIHIRYLIAFRDKDSIPQLPEDERQKIVSKKENFITLDVFRGGKETKGEEGVSAGEKYLSPTPIVQSDDDEIRSAALMLTKDKNSVREKAEALTHWVARRIEKKSLNVGYATAKEVFQTAEGDCTEHSVLLAAMLRAAGIPSRGAVGLVYSEEMKAFGYHMWTEAFVDGAWHALDATFDETAVNPTHIKIADSPLDEIFDVSLYSQLLKFMQNMEIKIISEKYEK